MLTYSLKLNLVLSSIVESLASEKIMSNLSLDLKSSNVEEINVVLTIPRYCFVSFAIATKYGFISTPVICWTYFDIKMEKNPQLDPISNAVLFFDKYFVRLYSLKRFSEDLEPLIFISSNPW